MIPADQDRLELADEAIQVLTERAERLGGPRTMSTGDAAALAQALCLRVIAGNVMAVAEVAAYPIRQVTSEVSATLGDDLPPIHDQEDTDG